MEGDTMNHTSDSATTADNGGNFDPRQAAALLGQTTQQARRKLEPSPPWLLATRAVMVLAACGAVWLSVRGQHPYRGPTAADIPVLVAFIVINFAATVAVRERAIAGVRGRSRLRPAEITILALAWAAIMAARAGWRSCGTGLAVAAVGAIGALAGPAGAWAVAGVGLCAVLLGNAAAVAWRQRRSVARP
jgi:hypothetical protein